MGKGFKLETLKNNHTDARRRRLKERARQMVGMGRGRTLPTSILYVTGPRGSCSPSPPPLQPPRSTLVATGWPGSPPHRTSTLCVYLWTFAASTMPHWAATSKILRVHGSASEREFGAVEPMIRCTPRPAGPATRSTSSTSAPSQEVVSRLRDVISMVLPCGLPIFQSRFWGMWRHQMGCTLSNNLAWDSR
ncbi:hypothetical protein P154DRAFT_263136 [Amniculicola lignicola CBS 123094]|uniref:Uncharacterized protein n=1 Tax=Amniculicola lignicola CBS 123094 TaxID=1392246 RepID=A0A6A5WG08_9PLEO|nr:hypothetical protein P154DRAFT_263136 [Amniculicola lignicola CBS 123094]